MKKIIEEILKQSATDLFSYQPNIFDFSKDTNQTEWNLGYHYSTEVHKYFPWFDYDLDVVKGSQDNLRPDIVFHKRGPHEFNFLVIEIKFKHREEIENTIQRIQDHWFQNPYSYKFGAAVNFERDKSFSIKAIQNN